MSRRKGAGAKRPKAKRPKAKAVAVVEIVPLDCQTCGEYHIGEEWERWYANPRGTKCPGGGK